MQYEVNEPSIHRAQKNILEPGDNMASCATGESDDQTTSARAYCALCALLDLGEINTVQH